MVLERVDGQRVRGQGLPICSQGGGSPDHADNLRYYAECAGSARAERPALRVHARIYGAGAGAHVPARLLGHGYCRDIVNMGQDTSPLVGGLGSSSTLGRAHDARAGAMLGTQAQIVLYASARMGTIL